MISVLASGVQVRWVLSCQKLSITVYYNYFIF